MEKIPTQIIGLDAILNGGFTDKNNDGSTIIVLRGERGINKTLLALQMMYGIGKSLNKTTQFYSLNKNEDSLKKMLGSIVISDAIENIRQGESGDGLWPFIDPAGNKSGLISSIRNDAIVFKAETCSFYDEKGKTGSNIKIKEDIVKTVHCNIKSYRKRPSADSYLSTEVVDFNQLLDDLDQEKERIGSTHTETYHLEQQDNNSGDKRHGCIVVEGFSSLSKYDVNQLPLNNLIRQLRNCARFAIIVLDNRTETNHIGVDIIIDMQRNEDTLHDYTYHELRISYSVFQNVAYGWHKYKSFGGMIRVYPSIHKILSQGVSVDTTFMRTLNDDMRYEHSYMEAYNEFPNNEISIETWINTPKYPIKNTPSETSSNQTSNQMPPECPNDVLNKVLCPDEKKSSKITSLVGANNTFKRYLAAISILNALYHQDENVLVLLLNEGKNGFQELIDRVRIEANISYEYAAQCYKRLSIWEVRMGCISPEELMYFIQNYISISPKRYGRDKVNQSIYIIDTVAIDYSFPMIAKETLFIPAIATMCKKEKVSLTFVCNKRFSLVDTVCSVSDNLLCLNRDLNPCDSKPEDIGKDSKRLTILLEKNTLGADYSSRVFEIKIDNIYDLIIHKDERDRNRNNIELKTDEHTIKIKEIPTTKDFWRQAVNIKNVVNTRRLN